MQTSTTQDHYRRRASQLIIQAELACGQPDLKAIQIAQWLIDTKDNYSKATWRQYKAALIFEFTQRVQLNLNVADVADLVGAIALLKQTAPPAQRPTVKKTSAQKQKKLNEADLICLVDHFKSKPTKKNKAAVVWLMAGLFTGLRPGEWETAEINAEGDLLVANAKATNGRAHGTHRIIRFAELIDYEKNIIKIHLKNVQQAKLNPAYKNQSGFELFYRDCRGYLYEANRKLWPNRKQSITLYSARHQFAANAKFSGLPLEHIAAVMGHASTATATLHYGRRISGNGNMRVKANNDDIARVTLLNQHRSDHGQRQGM